MSQTKTFVPKKKVVLINNRYFHGKNESLDRHFGFGNKEKSLKTMYLLSSAIHPLNKSDGKIPDCHVVCVARRIANLKGRVTDQCGSITTVVVIDLCALRGSVVYTTVI